MSRKTPIKELIAEEAGTPNSPIRRSSRIATRRSSAQEETLSQKLKHHDDESDRISISSTSSIGSKSERKTRTSSKSPLPPGNEEIGKIPVKRGRKGSTSSLIDEELASINRGGSPTPTRITRRSLARSISVSPISELESRKRNTSQRSISESSSKTGLSKRNLKMSSSEAVTPLESIEEQSPHKDKVINSIENTDEKDLPLKKKKSALLQTIDRNHCTDLETNKTESNLNCSSNEEDKSLEKTEDVNLNLEKDRKNVSFEERELRVVLNNIQEINVNIDVTKNIVVPQNENEASSKQAVELNFEDENLILHVSASDEDCKDDSKSVTVPTEKENPEKVLNGIQDDTLSDADHVDTSATDEVQREKSITEQIEVDVDTSGSKSRENDNCPDVSKDVEQPNLEVQTSVCVESPSSSTGPTSATLNLSPKPEILNRSSNEIQILPEKDKVVDMNDSVPNINLAAPESSDSVNTQSTPVRKETTLLSKDLSSRNSLDNETTVTLSPSPSKNKISNLSTDKPNAVDDHKLIVAASLTPLRRSPRLNTSDKKLETSSSENLTEDVLKINTPPDSIKSGNSPGDTEHEISGNELKNDFVSDATSKNQNDSKELNEKIVNDDVVNDESLNDNVEEILKDSKKEDSVSNLANKSKNEVSFNSEPELNSTLMKKITELTNNLEVESSSDESVNNFIDDMAEEAEEDTPSEGSNDIVDLGESVGSTESEIDSDESYELDSFIDDDEDEELLSGEEYDLDQEKSKRKPTKKRSRIVKIDGSSDEEKNKEELDNKVQATKKNVEISPKKKELNHKFEDDSDVENMSTKAYCGLTPPSVVSIRDSPSDEENKDFNNKEDAESITSVLINKEDNLESLEQIKDSIPENLNKSFKKSPLKVSPDKIAAQEKRKSRTPNNSVLESSTPNPTQRKRLSSLNIQETVNTKDISDGSISDRIMKVVEAFCSTVTKSKNTSDGNISLNVSLDFISTSPDKPKIHKEHTEIIVIEPSHQKTHSDAPAKSEFLTASNESYSLKEKPSPAKVLFTKFSSSDEQESVGEEEENNEVLIKPKRFKQNKIEKSKVAETPSEDELSKKNKRKKRKSTELILTTVERKASEEEPPISKRQRKISKNAKEVQEINSESDSDMSPDLDKELNEKYQDSEMEDEGSSSGAYNSKFDLSNQRKKLKKGKQKMPCLDISNMKASKKTKKTRNPNESVGDENVSPSILKNVVNKSSESQDKPRSPRKKRTKIPNVTHEGDWQIEYLPEEIKVALSLGRTNYQTQQLKSKEIKSRPNKKPKVIPTVNGGEKSWSSDKMNVSLKPTTTYNSKNTNFDSFHSKDFKNRTLFDSKRVKRVDTKELLKKKQKTNY
ncbi:hypothetical protein FQR65_LT00797 [Abscondita terminalis]|nr:hypothetical protein FQR65_LT00797 [Abscondita terminalis]